MSNDSIIDDDFFESLEEEMDVAQKVVKDIEIGVGDSELETKQGEKTPMNSREVKIASSFPLLVGTDYPTEYKNLVDRFLVSYSFLPQLNYEDLYDELAELSVLSNPTPTLQMVNLQLQKVQGSKDRLSEIFRDVIRCYSFKKRAVNILSDAWGKFAEGTSADKRKSDCAYRLSDFHRDLAEIEALFGTCEHVLKNLDSINNNISRQITIFQSQLKLHDIGRGSLPDFDFNKATNDSFDSIGEPVESNDVENKSINSGESVSASELTF